MQRAGAGIERLFKCRHARADGLVERLDARIERLVDAGGAAFERLLELDKASFKRGRKSRCPWRRGAG